MYAIRKRLGLWLSSIREEKKLTVNRLNVLAGLFHATTKNMESGKCGYNIVGLFKIAITLEISFFTEDKNGTRLDFISRDLRSTVPEITCQKKLGSWLKRKREEKQLTIHGLRKLSGVYFNSIQDIENGRGFSINSFLQIIAALNLFFFMEDKNGTRLDFMKIIEKENMKTQEEIVSNNKQHPGEEEQTILVEKEYGSIKNNKHWSEEEQQYLSSNYGIVKMKELMAHLHRRNDSIRQMAMTLGLTKKKTYWTLDDITFLKANKGKMTLQEIAERIGKTKRAVAHKIAYLTAESRHLGELSFDNNVPYYPTKAFEYRNMLGTMEIGQSFEYPASERQTVQNQLQIFPDRLFKSRLITETTRRIWRLL